MRLSAVTKCPYCGHEQQTQVDSPSGQEIVLCYPDDGGCDEWYAVFWQAALTTKAYPIGTEADRNGKRPDLSILARAVRAVASHYDKEPGEVANIFAELGKAMKEVPSDE